MEGIHLLLVCHWVVNGVLRGGAITSLRSVFVEVLDAGDSLRDSVYGGGHLVGRTVSARDSFTVQILLLICEAEVVLLRTLGSPKDILIIISALLSQRLLSSHLVQTLIDPSISLPHVTTLECIIGRILLSCLLRKLLGHREPKTQERVKFETVVKFPHF